MKEIADLHRPFMRWLDSEGFVYRRSRSDRATSELRGEPDFTIFREGRALLIEMKVEKGVVSPHQKRRHEDYARVGCRVFVVRDITAAIDLVRAWIGGGDMPVAESPKQSPSIVNRPGMGDWILAGGKFLRPAVVDDHKKYDRRTAP